MYQKQTGTVIAMADLRMNELRAAEAKAAAFETRAAVAEARLDDLKNISCC